MLTVIMMWVALCAGVFPLQELAKRGTAMAVARLLFCGEFGEGLADLRKIKKRIVAKTVGAPRRTQNETFGLAVESCQSVSVARNRDHADKTADAVLVGNVVEFAQQTRIVGFVG